MMTDTVLCESCHEAPAKWGYNDCCKCLRKQSLMQAKGLREFSDSALDPHAHDIDKAQEIIPVLQQMFVHRVSSRRDLNDATRLFLLLEGLRINHSCDAWSEVIRLKRIWKTRLQAQEEIDHWATSHGYAAF